MMPSGSSQLRRECHVFSSYLVGQVPSDYVLEKYCEAHLVGNRFSASGRFDLFLVETAVGGPLLTKLADSYARLLVPGATLRKKLILLLAILESCAPAHEFLDSVDVSSKPVLYLRIAQRGFLFVLGLLVSVAVLLPFHLAFAVTGKPAKRSR